MNTEYPNVPAIYWCAWCDDFMGQSGSYSYRQWEHGLTETDYKLITHGICRYCEWDLWESIKE